MRVLHVIPHYAPAWIYGGPVILVHALARAQYNAGCDVTVYTTDLNGSERLALPLGRETTMEGVAVTYFPTVGLGPFAFSPRMAAALHDATRRATIIHIHGLYTFPTLIACHRARAASTPYVISPHGMLDPYAIERSGRLKKTAYIRLVETRNLQRSACVHLASEEERALVSQLIVTSRAEVVPYPVPVDHAAVKVARGSARRIWPELDGRRLLLFMGRIDPKKGLEILIDAFSAIAPDHSDLQLVVAGDGSMAYIMELRERAAAHGLKRRVSFVGFVRGDAKAALLADSEVFLLTSHSENFGIAVVEALAAELPVIVSERVNLASSVAAAGAGLVTKTAPGPVAEAIVQIISPSTNRRAMGAAGAAWAQWNTDPAEISSRMIALYKRACGGGG